MAEYIERKAAEDVILGRVEWFDWEVVASIRAIPTADVVPVRHGRWIVSRIDYSWIGTEFPTHCKCDQCGREVPYQDRDNYCPACGADMREEEKDGRLH